MPVTAEMISGQRPGFIESVVAVAGTDVAVRGPGIPVTVEWVRIGTSAAARTLTFSPTESVYSNGIVTMRLYSDVQDTYRLIPIYGVTDEVP